VPTSVVVPRCWHWHDTKGLQSCCVVPLYTMGTAGLAAAPHEGGGRRGVVDRGGEGRRRNIEAEGLGVALTTTVVKVARMDLRKCRRGRGGARRGSEAAPSW
jgi:hypothetical protein